MINEAEIRAKFERLKRIVSSRRLEAIRESSKELADRMDKRIFRDGKKSNDTPIGQYSERYAEKRASVGLQVSYIDFVYTGRLRDSIEVLYTSRGSAKLVINDPERAKIAGYLQEKKGVVFKPTKIEIAMAKKLVFDKMKKG